MTDEELIARLRKFGDPWPDDHAAADRIKALVKERDEAYAYAKHLAKTIFANGKFDAPQWKPLEDTLGVLTQIDNMAAGIRARAEAAEAKVEKLRGALEWYAKDGWNDRSLEPPTPEEVEVFGDNILDFPMPEIFFDRGERARAALTETATTEEGK